MTEFNPKFTLPPDIDTCYLAARNERVVVVSIVGKSVHNVHQCKASMLHPVTDNEVFLPKLGDESNSLSLKDLSPISGYYDSERRVVFLHMTSVYDASALVNLCQKAANDISASGYSSFWQNAEYMHARALLYLFHVSHILLLVHPGNSFDVAYVRLFRILEQTRQKLQPSMTDVLRTLPVSKDWAMSGRPCSPRVLFVFESCNLDTVNQQDSAEASMKARNQKSPPIKRLQHAIEDQIYRILRKSRVITNISNNSLFAVPANQEFVFVQTDVTMTAADPVMHYVNTLRNGCITARESDGPRSKSYQTNRRTNQTSVSSNGDTPIHTRGRPLSSSSVQSADTHSFKEFLCQHIDLAHSRGFDDNVRRNIVPAVFELAPLDVWLEVSRHMYDFFLVDQVDNKARPHFNTLKSLLQIDTRFSESRCAKVLPLAESAYQEGLPQHYTRSYHQNKLLQAKRVFCQHARGPASDKYLRQLEEDCTKLWQDGRQLCEQTSLTGNHCVNQLHRLEDDFETADNKHLKVMQHSSQVKTKSACNCGRKLAERDDPFDHRSANYDFYQRIEESCCGTLEHYQMAVFAPSTSEFKAGVSPATDRQAERLTDKHGTLVRKDSSRLDIIQGMSGLSLALSLGQSGGSADIYSGREGHSFQDSHSPAAAGDSDDIPEQVAVEATSPRDVGPVRQPSTTEYLPGMVTTHSAPGLLPKFSSWSLVCLGKYGSYSPATGVDQPGFLHGSSFLLPWDVTVRGERDRWPSISDASNKKGKPGRKGQKDGNVEVAVRFYLGMEYECPRGHRFFCSSPDKIFKTPATGMASKESAHKLITGDMPLYFPCHCRSSKGYMAQLTRVFAAVPEGPVQLQLAPLVQPSLPPCPQYLPSVDTPITLQANSLWVLRFPYVYLGDKGPYMMPSDPQQLSACRVLRGMFTFIDVNS